MNIRTIVCSICISLIALEVAANAEPMNDFALDCIIEPSCSVNVGSEMPGIIQKITVDRGDIVYKGQLLVRLDSEVERATMESRRARYEFAMKGHKRKSELYVKHLISARDFDESETNLKIALRDLEEAEEIYERRSIRSMIDGIVVQRLLQPGERVEVQPILKLVQLSPLYVEVIAPASMLSLVKEGDRVAVRPENPIKGEYIGIVKIVDKVVDAASGTFGIRIELKNKDYTLPSGLKCKVRFLGKDKTTKNSLTSRRTPFPGPAA